MKIIAILFFGLLAPLATLQAAIPIATERSFQAQAEEKIDIEALKVFKLWLPGGFMCRVKAKVTNVTESASGLKVGDEIDIRYHWANTAGSYPGEVRKGKSYKAYLRLKPEKKHYEAAAASGTFVEVD